MRNMNIWAIAEAIGGKLENAAKCDMTKEATSVVIDSRLIEEGGIFVATKGERVDGHSFIHQVFEKGALAVICEHIPPKVKGPCIVVEDSLAAIRKLAQYYMDQLSVKVVGIVGSVGKTSTKELVASVLSSHYEVLRTEGNLNNEIGVPLTVFKIRDAHEVAVIEMGISDFGEMDRLGRITRPDIVVFTNIGPCHLEYLGDLEGVLRAKTEIIPHMNPSGTLVLNGQDEMLATISINSSGSRKIIRYGKESKRDDVYASSIENLGLEGSKFVANFPDGSHYDMTVPLPGYHMVDNAIAAAAVGFLMGLNLEEIRRGMMSVEPLTGRGHIIHTDKYTIVDDCYNANPKSMCAAIDTLGYALGRKVAILGDMFELGEETEKLHASVGEYAAGHGVESLIFVGSAAKYMYERARLHEGVEIRYYPNRELLISALSDETKEIIRPGDTILVKASHGMGFSEVVDYLSSKE
ncbi:MAG: UDP-N-acetylmuramoyl-tripeptide--D-alanyl-D-alanine ligase [Lachnospiraceae bacterium]|nr:UDP-N-acetylmuramoyl-tripeptide--D-alanyl-D-alanine ligase [Lachnospiraceae bacterium]